MNQLDLNGRNAVVTGISAMKRRLLKGFESRSLIDGDLF
jgi:hypothetical protein